MLDSTRSPWKISSICLWSKDTLFLCETLHVMYRTRNFIQWIKHLIVLFQCILASLIIVALKGVLLQVKDIVKIWRMSALDGIVWMFTYLTVIIVEIDIGLLVGLIISILTILFRGLRPNIYRLSRLPSTDIYVESSRYGKVQIISSFYKYLTLLKFCKYSQ